MLVDHHGFGFAYHIPINAAFLAPRIWEWELRDKERGGFAFFVFNLNFVIAISSFGFCYLLAQTDRRRDLAFVLTAIAAAGVPALKGLAMVRPPCCL